MQAFRIGDVVELTSDLEIFGDIHVAKGFVGVVRDSGDINRLYTVMFGNNCGVFKVKENMLKPATVSKTKSEDNIYLVAKHKAEMLDSYIISIALCGGSSRTFMEDIETMTVKEMIDCLAQNGVRFTTVSK